MAFARDGSKSKLRLLFPPLQQAAQRYLRLSRETHKPQKPKYRIEL